MLSLCLYSMYIFTSFILLFCYSNAIRISLNGNDWLVSNGQTLEATGAVHGTIHTIFLSARMIDEPYWGFGDINMRP